jgi:hypothetical protein
VNAPALSPEHILAAKAPAEVFGDDYKEAFQRLRSHWHPDRNSHPQAVDVFNKIINLGAIAKAMGESLRDDAFAELRYGGQRFEYLAEYPFALGTMRCNTRQVLFELTDGDSDLVKQYCDMAKIHLQAPASDKELAKQFAPLLPKVEDLTRHEGKLYLRVGLLENLVPLSAVLGYCRRLKPVHAAWIISRMLNCAVYCDYLHIVNNAFTLDSFFVDPESHAGFDIGGWFFSSASGGKLSALPKENLGIYPASALSRKQAESRADVFMIKRTAAQLLGDATGTGLKLDAGAAPAALLEWLRQPPLASALEEFRHWENHVLPSAFGKKNFCVFGINSAVILAKIGA